MIEHDARGHTNSHPFREFRTLERSTCDAWHAFRRSSITSDYRVTEYEGHVTYEADRSGNGGGNDTFEHKLVDENDTRSS